MIERSQTTAAKTGLGSYRAAEAAMHTFTLATPAVATTGYIECELDAFVR